MSTRPIAFLALALAGLACGGSSSNNTPGDGGTKSDGSMNKDSSMGPTAMEACMARTTAQCALVAKCSPYDLAIHYGTQDGCVQALTPNCIDSLSAPSSGATPTTAEACAMAYSSWSCEDFENNVNPPAACAQKTGSLASGAACGFPAQCQSGFCAIPPNALCGTCATQPSAGDSCANLTTCGTGLTCDGKSSTCVAYGAMGAQCSADAPCGYLLSCVGANAKMGIMGTCQTAVQMVGAACEPKAATSAACAFALGLTCNSTSKTCQMATFSGSGGACGFVDDQEAYCSLGGVCSAAAGKAGTCTAAAATGGACGGSTGVGCMTPARCIGSSSGGDAGDAGVSGTCQLDNASSCK
jgi:hypothetical protein